MYLKSICTTFESKQYKWFENFLFPRGNFFLVCLNFKTNVFLPSWAGQYLQHPKSSPASCPSYLSLFLWLSEIDWTRQNSSGRMTVQHQQKLFKKKNETYFHVGCWVNFFDNFEISLRHHRYGSHCYWWFLHNLSCHF